MLSFSSLSGNDTAFAQWSTDTASFRPNCFWSDFLLAAIAGRFALLDLQAHRPHLGLRSSLFPPSTELPPWHGSQVLSHSDLCRVLARLPAQRTFRIQEPLVTGRPSPSEDPPTNQFLQNMLRPLVRRNVPQSLPMFCQAGGDSPTLPMPFPFPEIIEATRGTAHAGLPSVVFRRNWSTRLPRLKVS